jgi:hypothetical protein
MTSAVLPPSAQRRAPAGKKFANRCALQTTKEQLMAKYGRKAQQKVERAMHERKRGTLKSGRSGKTVRSRKQAIAIGLSEARREGGKVPRARKAKKSKKSATTSRARKSSRTRSSSRKTARKSRKR